MNEDISNIPAASIVIKEWRNGRSIIPFIGSGLSAGSGFPLTSDLRDYLAKVEFFIRYGVFRRLQGEDVGTNIGDLPNSLEQNWSEYLIRYGWPDYNQINAELWEFADYPTLSRRKEDEKKIIPQKLNQLLQLHKEQPELNEPPNIAPYIFRSMTSLADRVKVGTKEQLKGDQLVKALRSTLVLLNRKDLSSWGVCRHRLDSIVQHILLENIRYEDAKRAETIQHAVWSHKLDIRLDWFRLILNIVEGRLGLIDSLFAQLSRHRSPSLGHRLIALLTRELGWSLLLTLNHDDLLEKAFLEEGFYPKVFDISRDATVPDAVLVEREPLSLIKLHGSTHGLRVGEPTAHALDETTKSQVLGYMPNDSLLLVLGFSGYERRMMSLIEAFALRAAAKGMPEPSILWMHWESKESLPEPVVKLKQKLGDKLVTKRLHDAGGWLLGLYQELTASLPRTKERYHALPKRALIDDKETASEAPSIKTYKEPKEHRQETNSNASVDEGIKLINEGYEEHSNKGSGKRPTENAPKKSTKETVDNFNDYPIQIFTDRELNAEKAKWDGKPNANASKALSRFVRERVNYQTVWIDLEDHHTVTGVVTDIINQLRVYDPELPPFLMPLEDSNDDARLPQHKRAVRFIHRAIKRGRYHLAFDCLGGFGRPQTMHHGLPRHELKKFELDEDGDKWHDLSDRVLEHLHDKGKETEEELKKNQRVQPLYRTLQLLDFMQALLHINDSDSASKRIHVLNYDWYFSIAYSKPVLRHPDKIDINSEIEKEKNRGPIIDEVIDKLVACSFREMLTFHWQRGSEGFQEQEQEQEQKQTEELNEPTRGKFRRAVLRVHSKEKTTPSINESNSSDDSSRLGSALADIVHRSDDWLAQLSPQCHLKGEAPEFAECIKKTLLEVADENPAISSDHLILALSVFRRPRSMAAIRWMDRWLESENIKLGNKRTDEHTARRDNALAIFSEDEMRYYSLDDRYHEILYKALSGPAWLSKLKTLTKKTEEDKENDEIKKFLDKDNETFSACTVRMAFLSVAHSQAGRYYYHHVWERSHDVAALFEYFYHRVASLKYLYMLEVVLIAHKNNLSPEERDEVAMSDCLKTVSYWLDVKWKNDGIEINYSKQIKKVLKKVSKLRKEYFRAFDKVVQREYNSIRAGAPSETWLGWIEMLRYAFPNELLYDNYGPKEKPEHLNNSKVKWQVPFNEASIATSFPKKKKPRKSVLIARTLMTRFVDLEASLLRERGDYLGCVRTRLDLLANLLPDGTDVEELKKLRDMAELQKELQQTRASFTGDPSKEYKKMLKNRISKMKSWGMQDERMLLRIIERSILDIASAIRSGSEDTQAELSGSKSDNSVSKNVTEPIKEYFRWAKDWLSIVSEAVETSTSKSKSFSNWKEFKSETRSSFIFHRLQLQLDTLDPLSEFLPTQKTVDNTIVNPAKKLRKKIRKEYEKLYTVPFNIERDFVIRRAHYKSLEGRAAGMAGDYNEALIALEEALNSVAFEGAEERFFEAIVHRYRAEVLQLRSRATLSITQEPNEQRLNIKKMRSKVQYATTVLKLASLELESQERLLRASRRNTRAWRRLYAGKTQQVIEELLLLALQVELGETTWVNSAHAIADVQRLLIQGLISIRGGLDCTLRSEKEDQKNGMGPRNDNPVSNANFVQSEHEYMKFRRQWSKLFVIGRGLIQMSDLVTDSERRIGTMPNASEFFNATSRHARANYPILWQEMNNSYGLSQLVDRFSNDIYRDLEGDPRERAQTAFTNFVHLSDEALAAGGDTMPDGTFRDFIMAASMQIEEFLKRRS